MAKKNGAIVWTFTQDGWTINIHQMRGRYLLKAKWLEVLGELPDGSELVGIHHDAKWLLSDDINAAINEGIGVATEMIDKFYE